MQWTVWVVLAALLAARALTAFQPSMWAWSLNLMRFMTPAVGWSLWVIGSLALIPGVARALAPIWSRAGDAIARRPALATGTAMALAVVIVAVWPDRVRFTGDFLLRQGTVEVSEPPATMFPQALPLDLFLHYTVPQVLANALSIDANAAARLLGVVEAAALAALALAFTRAAGLVGGAASTVSIVVFFGGYLGMFTGFSKAFAEMCLLVSATGVYGLRAVREGRGLLALGITFAIGMTLHRSALGLMPAVVFAWVVWWRTHRGEGGVPWRRVVLALALPLVSLVVMVPRIIAIVRRWDTGHFDPRASGLSGSVLSAAFAGARAVDLVNLVIMLSPLALLLGAWLVLARRAPRDIGREAALLILVALPFLAVMPFIHPAQGLFRDWDDFAATGVAVSLLVAWTVALALRESPRHWLAVAIAFGVVVPSIQWLVHNTELDHGIRRVRAFVLEPPPRADRERGTTWDYLGVRTFNLERYPEAAEAFAHAASTSPSPRILQEWALAETMSGHYADAQKIYYRFLEKSPENPLGWLGLAQVSLNLRDVSEARRAARQLLALQPGNSDAGKVLDEAARLEAQAPPASPSPAPAAGRR